MAKRVGGVELGLYAHERYLAKRGVPRSMKDLPGHAIIGYDHENVFIRKSQDQFPVFSRSALAFRADSDLAQLAAIRAGFGIGVCQSALAARDEALVRVLKTRFSMTLDTWLAMHEDLRESPRCAVNFAALAAGLSAYLRRPLTPPTELSVNGDITTVRPVPGRRR